MIKVIAVEETAHTPSPFNPDAKWLSPQWGGDEGMSIEIEVGDLIYGFIRSVKPRTVLETGTWKGFSAKIITHGLFLNRFGKITCVDLEDQKYIPFALKQDKIDKHGNGEDTWEKITGDILEVMPKMIEEGRKFDVIFCDDLHTEEHVKKELALFDKLIHRPGYLLFHDAYFTAHGHIGKTVRAWAEENGYDHIPFYTARGLDIVHVK